MGTGRRNGWVAWLAAVALGALSAGCGDDDDDAVSCESPGGAVTGAQDAHCGGNVVVVDPSACEGGGEADAGAEGEEEEAATMFNQEGEDDDCKYHLRWSSTPVCRNADVTFTLVATSSSDGSPLEDAAPYAEVFLDDTHPAPNSDSTSHEGPAGTYEIGPIRFDAAGQWTVRFHLYDRCVDAEDSPHGHGAFFVQVP